jgi:eukaryotic-like serine/threonine-protein kinase
VQKLCPQCQKPAIEGQQFCVHCGAALSGQRAPDEPTQVALAPNPLKNPPDELAGRLLDGKYHLLARIGAGGMGAVYQARRVHIGDEVAVKVLHAHYVTEASAVERFRREARAAAMLRHPSVVAIYDFGEARGNDPAFIVMELVEGLSLRALLQRERRLAPERAVALMREICAGVGAAHRHQVVHRDLKPDNVIITAPAHTGEFEKVKVLDFGIAKLRDLAPEQSLTQTGAVLGTPYYMSPEQCRGDALDARSDVYSLGAMLYEMIAGQPPFTAHTITGVVAKHLTETPTPLSQHAPVTPALEASIMRALAKDPHWRQADAIAFARDLQSALQNVGPRVIEVMPEPRAAGSLPSNPTIAVPPPQTVPPRAAQTVLPGPATTSAPVTPAFANPPKPIVPVAHPVTALPSAVEKTVKQNRSMVYWASVSATVLILLAGVGAWLVQYAELLPKKAVPSTSPSPTPPPVASPSNGKLLTSTTAAADDSGYVAKPLSVPRVASAEAILVGGEAITEKDLAELGLAELRVLRNVIFARHGRMFESPGLQRYFGSRPWYKPSAAYSDDLLTEADRSNLEVLAAAERQAKVAQATTAHASSRLSEQFAPENTRDERADTAWVEGAPGPGIGEWIAFTFKPQTIQYLELFPGYGKSKDLFFANHRLKRATLIFSDGTRTSVQLFDEMRVQTVALQAPVRTSSLRLIIEEVFPGAQYDDTAIAEISWR